MISLCESLREIAESIVVTSTQEGKTLLRAADEIEQLHGKLDRARDQARYSEELLRQTTSALENLVGRLA